MSLIADLLAQQTGQTPTQTPTARTGLQLLLNEAQKTAGMFGAQVGRAAGIDNRPQAVKDMEQIQQIIKAAPGATEAEKLENAIPAIAEINPVLASQLQGRVRTQGAKQGIAQRLAEQGHDDLAAAYMSGEMTADQAITEARQRKSAESRGGNGQVLAPTANEVKLFTGIANQSPDISAKLESMAQREDVSWLGRLVGSEGDIKEGSQEELIRVAASRAKEIKAENPDIGNRQAFQQAINEMYTDFSQASTKSEGNGTQAVQPTTSLQAAVEGLQAGRTVRVQRANGERVNVRLGADGQPEIVPDTTTEEDRRQLEEQTNPYRID